MRNDGSLARPRAGAAMRAPVRTVSASRSPPEEGKRHESGRLQGDEQGQRRERRGSEAAKKGRFELPKVVLKPQLRPGQATAP
jgi:hypothetical protein